MRLKFGAKTDAGQHNEVANAAGAFLKAELCRVEHWGIILLVTAGGWRLWGGGRVLAAGWHYCKTSRACRSPGPFQSPYPTDNDYPRAHMSKPIQLICFAEPMSHNMLEIDFG